MVIFQQTRSQEFSSTNTDRERENKWLKKEKDADQSDLRPVKTLSGRFGICLKVWAQRLNSESFTSTEYCIRTCLVLVSHL